MENRFAKFLKFSKSRLLKPTTMRYFLFYCFFFCVSLNGEHSKDNPPGTVKVADNLFVDKWEVTNIDYGEYLYWLSKVFTKDSPEYVNAFPDVTVWRQSGLPDARFLEENYFVHPFFYEHPVVGVSWEQANDYLKWRTDRVYEMMLIGKGVIPQNPDQDGKTHFTYKRFKKGEYLGIKPTELPLLPYYSLPTEEEWELMAGAGNDISAYPYSIEKDRKELEGAKGKKYFNTLNNGFEHKALKEAVTVEREYFKPNKFKLFNTIGNVCEMTREKGTAKGGSWHHKLADCAIDRSVQYSSPECWLGFRAVCKWMDITGK